MGRKRDGREIIKRIIVRGVLVLNTPTCLSNGDAEGVMMLLRDSSSPKALLTGSSVAGALRNYLHEYEKDYCKSATRQDMASKLFGDLFAYKNEKDKSEQEKIKLREKDSQSPLIIDDALSSTIPKVELRDGVKINGATGTADDGAKYDLEFLTAGTQFALSFELLVQEEAEAELKKSLAIALSGLEKGEVSLGMKKRRGFGRCHVGEWQVWEFDLRQHSDRIAWLTFDRPWAKPYAKQPNTSESIAEVLGVTLEQQDKRDRFSIQATFKLASSLLIRSGQDTPGRAPDVVHLKSHRSGKTDAEPVLSGTSLAGVLRHRAERIVNTLHEVNQHITQEIVNDIFGFVSDKKASKQPEANEAKKKPDAKASCLVVHETVIKDATELVQNRIAIDRFTGGAYHGALFDEQPIFGGNDTRVTIELELRKPEKYEIGLLLLLLKDLWTSDLPVGGESSIGRGRLKGTYAKMTCYESGKSQEWVIHQQCDNSLRISHPEKLGDFVKALVDYSASISTPGSDKETAA
jgi:CRISPR/Cas system CSM-associated protein Csm3 (group 7 of RAMP superfamily)